jgi:PPOX class probable F420-dependent enzyme
VVSPVWFVLEGDELVFNTGKASAKGKAFARDPRIAICVDLEGPPYSSIQIQGTVTLSEDLDELVRTATEIAGRYMGADRAEEFGKRNGVPGELVVRVRPTKVLANFDATA